MFFATKDLTLPIFLLFVVLHVLFLNFNATEWGDSYRILRASEYIKSYAQYPANEKRPPLYSLILSFRPGSIDQVLWGRLVMFVVSILSFALFLQLVGAFFVFKLNKPVSLLVKNTALLLFTLNPVYFYWSVRVMADTFFAFLMMLSVYFYLLGQHSLKRRPLHIALTGIFTGLAIATRFEGYILCFSLGVGIMLSGFVLQRKSSLRSLVVHILSRIRQGFHYLCGVFLVLGPLWYFRNPLSSSYFDEPGRRVYDISTFAIFLLSLLFLFGGVFTCYFLFRYWKRLSDAIFADYGILTYIFIELLLILLWPAAIPRLFVAVLPLFFLFIAFGLSNIFYEEKTSPNLFWRIAQLFLLILYIVGQYVYRLQFLVVSKYLFGIIVVLSLVQFLLLYKGYFKAFYLSLFGLMFLWLLGVLYPHKPIYSSLKASGLYSIENLQGRVMHNDNDSILDWYLNYKEPTDRLVGVYKNFDGNLVSKDTLEKENIAYLIFSNENNPDATTEGRSFLKEMTRFKYEVNGKLFTTIIFQVIMDER